MKTVSRSSSAALSLIVSLTLVLSAFLALPSSSLAQDDTSVFAPGVNVNRTFVSQIEAGLAATDLATLQANASAALGTGRSLVSLLETIQSTTGNDAVRSRAEGLLSHVQAAQSALEASLTRGGLTEARSDLDAARGEAVEALFEISPFETAAAPTTELPVSGSPSPLLLVPLVAVGLVLLALGNRIRRA